MSSSTDTLEARARRVGRSVGQTNEPTPLSQLEERIGFILDRLESVREVHKEQLLSILRNECTIDTSLMRLDSYSPMTWHYRGNARTRLKEGLLKLERERRDLRQAYDKELSRLHEILLELLSKRAHLSTS